MKKDAWGNHLRLIHVCCSVEVKIKATTFETCAISCPSCICKRVTSVPTAQGEIIGCCKTEATKRLMLSGEGGLRNGSLSVWLKHARKS